METEFTLDIDEIVLLKETGVYRGDKILNSTNLTLTNKRFICQTTNVWGKIKSTELFPLSELKVYNGMPQAIKTKASNGSNYLYLYFLSHEESFNFQASGNNNKIIDKWIAEIQRLFEYTPHVEEKTASAMGVLNDAIRGIRSNFQEVKKEFATALGLSVTKKTQETDSFETPQSHNDGESSLKNSPIETKCPHCNSIIEEGIRFCTNCGERLDAPQTNDNAPTVICKQCGIRVPSGQKFCTECGAPIDDLQEKPSEPAPSFVPDNDKDELTLDQKTEALEKLKSLVVLGVLSQKEYEQKKKEIL